MNRLTRKMLRLLGVCCAVLVCAGAQAQSNTPIKIITPFTVGTGYDTTARAVGNRLAEKWGTSVIVQNMPGASGNIGTEVAAKSPADGTTLLMGGNTMLISSQLYKNVPFHPLKDFTPLTLAATGTLMLVAHPKVNVRTVQELVQLAKSKPGHVNFGSPGVGTPHHMAMELFKLETQTFMLHVPYRGTAGYTQDLLAGELMTGFLPVHVAQGFVRTGKLVALGLGSPKRHPVAPDVPTMIELGYKNVDVDLWYAFFVPAKTPAATVARLNADISSILREPAVRDILNKGGMDARSSTSEELGAMAQRDYERWGQVIRAKSITAD